LPHSDGKVVIVLLGFLARGVLGEKYLDHLSEVVERARWQQVEPVRGHTSGWLERRGTWFDYYRRRSPSYLKSDG